MKKKNFIQNIFSFEKEIPSLETLVLSSVIPDAIFNKLSEQVENGNPLLGIQVIHT